jgi:hypothetical protein
METPRVTIRLDKDLNRRLTEAARVHHQPVAEFARRVLQERLDGQDRRLSAVEQSLQRLISYCEELVQRPLESTAIAGQVAKLLPILERVLVQQTESLMIQRVVIFRDSPADYQRAVASAEKQLKAGVDGSRTLQIPHEFTGAGK